MAAGDGKPPVTNGRFRWLRRLEAGLEAPMVLLAFVWLGLMVVEFTGGRGEWLISAGNVIWAVFVVDFLLRLFLARRKLVFLRRNGLTLVSLALPALRIFRLARVLRLARAGRGLRLLRLGTSIRRTVRALMKNMGRKGFGYVMLLTLVVTVAGAAGMYALEPGRFSSYWDALWWTAMIMTTMGSEAWPVSAEGRVLCLALALYAFSIFGYVTAALASFLVEQSAAPAALPTEAAERELADLRAEVARLARAIEERER